MTAQKNTAVTIMASVVIVCPHTPIRSRKTSASAVKMATPRPAVRQAMKARIAVNTSIGIAFRNPSNPSRTKEIGA
jgi:hypothetical protein